MAYWPAWVTENIVPAIVNAFVRPSGAMFGRTVKFTVPGPAFHAE